MYVCVCLPGSRVDGRDGVNGVRFSFSLKFNENCVRYLAVGCGARELLLNYGNADVRTSPDDAAGFTLLCDRVNTFPCFCAEFN